MTESSVGSDDVSGGTSSVSVTMTGWHDQEHNDCSIACWVSRCSFQSRGRPNAGNVPSQIPFIMVTTSRWISGPSGVTMTTVFHRLTLWPWQLHQAMLSHGPLCLHGTSGMAASLCRETTSPSPPVSHCRCHQLWGWHSLVWSWFIPTHNHLSAAAFELSLFKSQIFGNLPEPNKKF